MTTGAAMRAGQRGAEQISFYVLVASAPEVGERGDSDETLLFNVDGECHRRMGL